MNDILGTFLWFLAIIGTPFLASTTVIVIGLKYGIIAFFVAFGAIVGLGSVALRYITDHS